MAGSHGHPIVHKPSKAILFCLFEWIDSENIACPFLLTLVSTTSHTFFSCLANGFWICLKSTEAGSISLIVLQAIQTSWFAGLLTRCFDVCFLFCNPTSWLLHKNWWFKVQVPTRQSQFTHELPSKWSHPVPFWHTHLSVLNTLAKGIDASCSHPRFNDLQLGQTGMSSRSHLTFVCA